MTTLDPSGEAPLRQLKAATHSEAVRRSVDLTGPVSLSLVPAGSWILEESELIAKMAQWRAHARDMYFARFPESASSMSRYLSEVSIARDDVVLFIIEGIDGSEYGHIGLTNVTSSTAEIDQVMKAPIGAPKGAMQVAMQGLVTWSASALQLRQLSLRVLSYNIRAIDLYERIGFRETDQRTLRKTEHQGITTHDEVDAKYANVDYYCSVMTLSLTNRGIGDQSVG